MDDDDDEWDVEKGPLSPLDTLTLAKNRCTELLQIIKGEMETPNQTRKYMRKMLELADANFISITEAGSEAGHNGVSALDIHDVLGDLPRDSFGVIQELNQIVYN